MKQYIAKYKDAIGFILRFFGVYILFSVLYTLYVNAFEGIDGITTLVAKQSNWLLELFGYHSEMVAGGTEPFYKVLVNGAYVARIIEGCNSISVLILFVTFVIAFKGSIKHTVVYALLGVLLLYIVNLFRIVVLTIGVYEFPEYTEMLHGLVFPAIIYGTMLLLWVYWVKQFAKR